MRTMLFRLALAFSILFGMYGSGYPIDPGTAHGALELNGEAVRLNHAYAHLHDNAERLLMTRKELRILLTDREVPQELLGGLNPAAALISEPGLGDLRGILLQTDPDNPDAVTVTLLLPLSGSRVQQESRSAHDSANHGLKSLKLNRLRVTGILERPGGQDASGKQGAAMSKSVRFSAPLFHERAVTANLSGKAAGNSTQARLLREKVRAMLNSDTAKIRAISTERASREFDASLAREGDSARAWMKKEAATLEKALETIRRVVVRNDRAVMIWDDNSWTCFLRKGAEWKID